MDTKLHHIVVVPLFLANEGNILKIYSGFTPVVFNGDISELKLSVEQRFSAQLLLFLILHYPVFKFMLLKADVSLQHCGKQIFCFIIH